MPTFGYTPGGNAYPLNSSAYDQSEFWRQVALNRDVIDQQAKDESIEYVESVRFYKGETGLTEQDSFDDLPSGVYTIWNGDVATSLGLPEAIQGTLEVHRWGAAGGVAEYRARSIVPRIYSASRLSGGWSDWVRTDGDDARFYRGQSALTEDDNVDDLDSGVYTIWNGDVATSLGLPEAIQGTLEVHRWGAAGGVAEYRARSIVPRIYSASRLSGGWSDWVRTDAGGVAHKQKLPPAAPASLKAAPLALTMGYGGATTSGSGTVAVIQHLPATIERLRLHVRNWNPRYTNADRAPATLTNVRVGRHTGNGGGTEWVNLPTGATAYTSNWITVPATWQDAEIVVQYSWSGSDVTRTWGTAWVDGSRSNTPELWPWLEVEAPATTPVVAAFGSSTAIGVGATRPVIDSWLGQWCRNHGAIPAFWAHSGDSAVSWTPDADRKWELYGDNIAAPEAMIYAMGSNDWSSGVDLATLQDRLTSTVQEIKERITVPIYGTTITPRATPPANDATRTALNDWMPGSGLFRDVFDFAAAVALPDGTLDPAVDADGIHVTTEGHARLAAAVPAGVVTPPDPGPYESGPRTVTGEWPGTFIIERNGNDVEVTCTNGRPPTAGTSTALNLPTGFRPARNSIGAAAEASTTRPVAASRWSPWNVDVRGIATAESWVDFSLRFKTADPIPTTLPGDPA